MAVQLGVVHSPGAVCVQAQAASHSGTGMDVDDVANSTPAPPPQTDAGESKETTQATGLLVDAALRCRHAVRRTLRAAGPPATEQGATEAAVAEVGTGHGVEGTVELLRLRIDAAQSLLASVHNSDNNSDAQGLEAASASAALRRLEQASPQSV